MTMCKKELIEFHMDELFQLLEKLPNPIEKSLAMTKFEEMKYWYERSLNKN